ncbi:carbohydrate porin [Klebsiella indica]|uniref:Carbohydrate porin n=2 Tax=Klebsiella indica TaxID=2582917 RepID=A0A5R9LD38_9ENTR|nr:carbohydrate porin [Klebsiella indica]
MMMASCSYLIPTSNVLADDNNNDTRPLSDTGKWLTDHGVQLHLMASENWLGSLGAGSITDKRESFTLLTAGADFDLDKMGLIPGGSIHIMQLWVPFTHNIEYGNQVGSLLAGNPPSYLPKVAHLMRFTYEQKLLDDRLELEAGKSNPDLNFGLNYCNVYISCINTLLNDTAVMGAVPYAGWGARIGWNFTPNLKSNIGIWRTYQAYPFTSGWEWGNDSNNSGTTLLLANLNRHITWQEEPYPFNWEILAFHNLKKYDDPYYTVNGTSKVFDTESAVRTHTGVSGFYITANKTFWRRDGGSDPSNPSPEALSVHGSLAQAMKHYGDQGITTFADLGVTWNAPWQSRPQDSYGVFFRWGRLSDSKQRYLQDEFIAAGGSGWQEPQNEYQLGLDASLMLTPEINIQMSGARTWRLNTYQYAYTASSPRSGYTFWLQLNVMIDKLLGL